jgi:hypothetical protein
LFPLDLLAYADPRHLRGSSRATSGTKLIAANGGQTAQFLYRPSVPGNLGAY